MSLELLRDNLRRRVTEKADGAIDIMMRLKFRPAGQMGDGAVIPANTLEEIAVKAIECNAYVEAYAWVLRALDEEFKHIVDPTPPAQEGETKTESMY